MEVDVEKSKAEDRKCEDVGEKSDLDERKTMEETKRDEKNKGLDRKFEN